MVDLIEKEEKTTKELAVSHDGNVSEMQKSVGIVKESFLASSSKATSALSRDVSEWEAKVITRLYDMLTILVEPI
jgi:hypothetical protein